ncbi:MAG: hypothetical protein R3231_13025, partial [bacterium]|nr:hypothetical protein [bacterium]
PAGAGRGEGGWAGRSRAGVASPRDGEEVGRRQGPRKPLGLAPGQLPADGLLALFDNHLEVLSRAVANLLEPRHDDLILELEGHRRKALRPRAAL